MIDNAELSRIEREAIAMLSSLAGPAIVDKLRPRPDDFARVFQPEAVERAIAGFSPMWNEPPVRLGKPGQTQVLAHACEAQSLARENDRSRMFPGGYYKIAHLLVPDIVWVAFKLVVPGEASGMAYDGLVRLDDRWAWFPKPWRFLADADDVIN